MKQFKIAVSLIWCLILPYLASYALCWLVLLTDNFYLWSLLYLVGAATPVLFVLSGYFAPASVREAPIPHLALLFAILTLLPTAVIWWGESAGIELVWMLDMPHRMTALTYFFPLLTSSKSAFTINVLEPLCNGLSHMLMMGGLVFGMFVRKQNAK